MSQDLILMSMNGGLFIMIEMVEKDPFIPIAWQSKHTGMQGNQYLDIKSEQQLLTDIWLEARWSAVSRAKLLNAHNLTKQLCNRLLEPFMWHTTLCTFTESENFFNLRLPIYEIDLDNLEELK